PGRLQSPHHPRHSRDRDHRLRPRQRSRQYAGRAGRGRAANHLDAGRRRQRRRPCHRSPRDRAATNTRPRAGPAQRPLTDESRIIEGTATMRAFEHRAVRSAEEAVAALQADTAGETSVIAGGAELLSLMKANLIAPARIIDLKPARELRGVSLASDGSVRIGALTTLADTERDATLAARLPMLPAAVRDAATPQLRNMATVGGNLMQRNRCWYFRGPYDCWLKGGDQCLARDG